MNDTVIVNDKTLPWLFVQRGFKIPSFNFEVKIEEVPGRSGSVYQGRELKQYEFELPLVISNDHLAHSGIKSHDDILNELVKFFNYDKQVKLQFKSKEWYWNAYFEGPIELFSKTENQINVVNLKVVLSDPYKYSAKGNKNTAISDAVSVVNTGTADTPILVEARALKNSNYFMITKKDEDYFMIGDDDVDKKVKDYSPLILGDELRSLKGWNKQSSNSINDKYTGGAVGGTFSQSTSKESVYLNTESINGSGWQGGMYKRSFSKQIHNFSATFKIAVNQKRKGANRTAQYLYDTDGRVIASIGYTNPNANQAIGRIIICLYNQSGEPKKIYDYKNNPSIYKMDEFVVYMRLIRIGKEFTIKTWKYREIPYPLRKIAFDTHEVTFTDKGEFYNRPISAVSIYSAKNGTNNFMPVYLLGSYIRELLEKPPGENDMIIKSGDDIVVDMTNNLVMVNGEPFIHEKTFGSDYFNVDSGHSELIIQPPNTFDTTIKWQDRWY
ncbi:phage tail family protein [Staphylococcus simulans]|uniref:phage tail family protein n=1 Tax=Staphylococcus simulans TaxID=1286 RepID=UPI0021CE43D3|nr:phage tail family protein [Staphylococcus simulans]UXR29829.1 phage tail family protein [Staphylococcus simulans]